MDPDGHFLWAGATNVPNPRAEEGAPSVPAMDAGSTDTMELSRLTAPPPAAVASVGVAVDRSTFVLPPKEFIAQETPKDMIVLHFTAGRTARSAFDTWRNDPRRIGTAYLVDVDGTIYEVFPPKFWAAHLGIPGTKNVHDRRSIGIEIANVGPLQPSAENPQILNWWLPRTAGSPEFTTKFCGLDEIDKFTRADFRTKRHFAAFPDVQIDAVAALVRGLCEEFDIPATLPSGARRFDSDPSSFATYKGVCSHANFRQDKWDIGPAFAWERLGL
jgi:N-acetyl-anhydromuramyl-L-alanine amidase AmpD